MLYTHSLHVNKEECFSNACFSFDENSIMFVWQKAVFVSP